jgi:hypothetical protein
MTGAFVWASVRSIGVGRRRRAFPRLWSVALFCCAIALLVPAVYGLGLEVPPSAHVAVRASPGWRQLTPATHPGNLSGFAMAYDAKDGYVVGFGGLSIKSKLSDETWAFSAGNWTQLYPTLSPPGTGNTALVYDNSTQQVIYFGGWYWPSSAISPTPLNQTWAFSGGTWTQLTPPHSPPPGEGAMTFDPATGSPVLYEGSRQSNGSVIFQTWTFQNGSWSRVQPGKAPLQRPIGLVYDPDVGGVVLIGQVSSSNLSVESWILKSGTWRHLTTTNEPPVSTGYGCPCIQSVVYDPLDGFLLLVAPGSFAQHTWKFQHEHWTQLTSSAPPRERQQFGLTFDTSDGYVVMFGGRSLAHAHDYAQTWTF